MSDTIDNAIAKHDDDKHAVREVGGFNWPLVVGRGVLRDKALADADEHEQAILSEIRRAKAAGHEVNLSRVERDTGVSRSTLIRKLS